MVIWIHSLSTGGAEETRSLANLLRDRGVEAREYSWSLERVPGIVLLSECNESALFFIRDASLCGGARIVALARDKSTLSGGVAWKLLNSGASDVMVWDGTAEVADNLAERLKRWNTIDEILDSAVVKGNLIGRSAAWVRVLRDVIEIARFSSASVLISGESGTGKELVARLIHTLDARQNKGELVVLDCTTVVPELSGSEFFGHEKGAYTGAVASRDGAFALANGGTLFLDEVGELPHTLQAELLRAVQEHTYKRHSSPGSIFCGNKLEAGRSAQNQRRRAGISCGKRISGEHQRAAATCGAHGSETYRARGDYSGRSLGRGALAQKSSRPLLAGWGFCEQCAKRRGHGRDHEEDQPRGGRFGRTRRCVRRKWQLASRRKKIGVDG